MPKLHTTAAYRLLLAEATIQQQAEIIAERNATIVKLEAKLAILGVRIRDSTSTSSSVTRRQSSTLESTETASYRQQTASSRAKFRVNEEIIESSELLPLTKITSDGTKYVYIDGVLVVDGPKRYSDVDRPNYERHTNSSLQRSVKGWGSLTFGWDDTTYPSDTEDTDMPTTSSSAGWSTPPSSSYTPEPEPELDETRQPVEATPDPVDILLAKTRLGETPWDYLPYGTKHPASFMHLDSKYVYKVLHRAHILAQEAFHAAAREHWPDIWKSDYSGGRHEVRFGRTDMGSTMRRIEFGSRRRLAAFGRHGSCIPLTVDSLANLRNAVCHFGGGSRCGMRTAADVDRYLKDAQELAVRLLDENRAVKVRALRDGLRDRAEAELRAFEDAAGLAALPGCRLRWKRHQEELLCVTSQNTRDSWPDFPPDYPASVLQAAEEWEKRRGMD